ncbi:MAG: DUF2750 domain-containing protein [Coriobacteriales bacterium]|nr:DUF2750 domain-containing protein [Coriobacteriales bacterium]
MDTSLKERVSQYAPPWVRYMLTLSEISKTGDGWVVAEGDDLALWDTDGGATLPIWPYQEFAELSADDEAEAVPVSSTELMERLLPFLTQNDATLSLFPNFEDDVLVSPEAVGQDLTDFVAEPADVAAQIAEEPRGARLSDWAMLETPEIEGPEPAMEAPPMSEPMLDAAAPAVDRYEEAIETIAASGWVWVLEADDDFAGVVIDDEPALAIFPTREYANAFAALSKVPANAKALPARALVDPWLVVAFAGGWRIAVSPVGDSFALVNPARFALDLGEAGVSPGPRGVAPDELSPN